MRPRLFVLLLLALSSLAHAQTAPPPEPDRIRIEGSNRLGQALVPALVDRWLADIGYTDNRHLRRNASLLEIHAIRDGEPLVVEIRGSGTTAGLQAITQGKADLSMSLRPPTDAEMDAAWQLGNLRSPTQEWVLGLDGIVVLVPPTNPVPSLSVEQLRGILTGRRVNWRELGAPARPITLHTLGASSGTLALATSLLTGDAPLAIKQVPHASQASLLAAVAADPGAIALVSLKVPRTGLKAVAVSGASGAMAPDLATIVTEGYPLQRRVYLHSGGLIPALARSLAQYAVSPAGQSVVERSSFVSVGLRVVPPGDVAALPADYVALLDNAERLPATLRFSTGLDLFDSRSRQDIDRLVTYLAEPGNAGRSVVLMSFAQPRPASPYQSLALSHERVDYVASELRALGLKVVMARGFGGQMPLADPSAPAAAYRNNRVEVWLR